MPHVCESLMTHMGLEAKIGGWWMNASGERFYWTDSVHSFFGSGQRDNARFTLESALVVFSATDREIIRKAMESTLKSHEPFCIEALLDEGDGCSKRYIRMRGQYVAGIPGIALMGSIQDVSEIKRLVAIAEHNQSKYKNVIESAMDAIISIDGAQKIVLFNREAERMFGYQAEEVLGQPLDILMPQRSRVAHEKYVGNYLKDGAHSYRAMGRNSELFGRRKDGSEFAIEASLSKFKTEDDVISTAIVRDASIKKEYEKKIYTMAFTDKLTGLGNRNALYKEFPGILETREMLELALIDIDRFKDVNDSLGYHVGDNMLAKVGELLQDTASRYACHAYRLASDVFVLLSTHRSIDPACRSLLSRCSAPMLIEGNALWRGISIGVSSTDSSNTDKGVMLEGLIKCADAALLQVKQKGGGRIEYFNPNMLPFIEAKTLMHSHLEELLTRHEFYYVFQPIVDIRHGVTLGYEALARWRHDGHAISPETFIPLADESGYIHRIQEYLFRYLADCLDVLGDNAFLALNICPSQLASDRLHDSLLWFFAQTGFPPSRMELELTERSLLLVGQETMHRLQRLKNLGCRLSIDDFGTGYSCLSYLKELPIDKMKIDKSFVINIGNDPKNLAVVATIIDLAKRLGMATLAEGIENASQADVLLKMGCHEGQGYLYSKPLTVEQIRKA